jgi:hypothetical protein
LDYRRTPAVTDRDLALQFLEMAMLVALVLLTAARATPDSPALQGAMALNISSPSSDVGIMARYFSSANFAPNGFNFEQWKDDEFDDALKTIAEATDPKAITAAYRKAHERLVDNPLALYRPRSQPARDVAEGQGFRFATVMVRRSDPGQHAIGRSCRRCCRTTSPSCSAPGSRRRVSASSPA